MKTALISVSDKRGIIPFAEKLIQAGIRIISTGGTYKALKAAGLQVTPVDEVTGFSECLEGRVKTLHPAIHGGILARRSHPNHMDQLAALKIDTIDYVIINLYPFEATIQKPGVSFESAIENIDIGGPTMLRSAAKNHQDVTVVVDPEDYEEVAQALLDSGTLTLDHRFELALKVFEHTAYYDALIARYLRQQSKAVNRPLPKQLTLPYEKVQTLRYGENPFQEGYFYKSPGQETGGLQGSQQLNGKALSYNNINDTNGAIALLKEFKEKPTVVAVKHANPCGVGQGFDLSVAFDRAKACDPVSIFGGIIAANRVIDLPTAKKIRDMFLEVVIAPGYEDAALALLKEKKNLRILCLKDILEPVATTEYQVKSVIGGLLIQSEDGTFSPQTLDLEGLGYENVTDRQVTHHELEALLFNWKVCKHVKSNGIVIGQKDQTQGIGVGQVSRIFAVEDAVNHSQSDLKGSVLASDAFFPFPDALEIAIKAGVTAVIQPGGSINDPKVIELANAYGVAMIFTKERHFKH